MTKTEMSVRKAVSSRPAGCGPVKCGEIERRHTRGNSGSEGFKASYNEGPAAEDLPKRRRESIRAAVEMVRMTGPINRDQFWM